MENIFMNLNKKVSLLCMGILIASVNNNNESYAMMMDPGRIVAGPAQGIGNYNLGKGIYTGFFNNNDNNGNEEDNNIDFSYGSNGLEYATILSKQSFISELRNITLQVSDTQIRNKLLKKGKELLEKNFKMNKEDYEVLSPTNNNFNIVWNNEHQDNNDGINNFILDIIENKVQFDFLEQLKKVLVNNGEVGDLLQQSHNSALLHFAMKMRLLDMNLYDKYEVFDKCCSECENEFKKTQNNDVRNMYSNLLQVLAGVISRDLSSNKHGLSGRDFSLITSKVLFAMSNFYHNYSANLIDENIKTVINNNMNLVFRNNFNDYNNDSVIKNDLHTAKLNMIRKRLFSSKVYPTEVFDKYHFRVSGRSKKLFDKIDLFDSNRYETMNNINRNIIVTHCELNSKENINDIAHFSKKNKDGIECIKSYNIHFIHSILKEQLNNHNSGLDIKLKKDLQNIINDRNTVMGNIIEVLSDNSDNIDNNRAVNSTTLLNIVNSGLPNDMRVLGRKSPSILVKTHEKLFSMLFNDNSETIRIKLKNENSSEILTGRNLIENIILNELKNVSIDENGHCSFIVTEEDKRKMLLKIVLNQDIGLSQENHDDWKTVLSSLSIDNVNLVLNNIVNIGHSIKYSNTYTSQYAEQQNASIIKSAIKQNISGLLSAQAKNTNYFVISILQHLQSNYKKLFINDINNMQVNQLLNNFNRPLINQTQNLNMEFYNWIVSFIGKLITNKINQLFTSPNSLQDDVVKLSTLLQPELINNVLPTLLGINSEQDLVNNLANNIPQQYQQYINTIPTYLQHGITDVLFSARSNIIKKHFALAAFENILYINKTKCTTLFDKTDYSLEWSKMLKKIDRFNMMQASSLFHDLNLISGLCNSQINIKLYSQNVANAMANGEPIVSELRNCINAIEQNGQGNDIKKLKQKALKCLCNIVDVYNNMYIKQYNSNYCITNNIESCANILLNCLLNGNLDQAIQKKLLQSLNSFSIFHILRNISQRNIIGSNEQYQLTSRELVYDMVSCTTLKNFLKYIFTTKDNKVNSFIESSINDINNAAVIDRDNNNALKFIVSMYNNDVFGWVNLNLTTSSDHIRLYEDGSDVEIPSTSSTSVDAAIVAFLRNIGATDNQKYNEIAYRKLEEQFNQLKQNNVCIVLNDINNQLLQYDVNNPDLNRRFPNKMRMISVLKTNTTQFCSEMQQITYLLNTITQGATKPSNNDVSVLEEKINNVNKLINKYNTEFSNKINAIKQFITQHIQNQPPLGNQNDRGNQQPPLGNQNDRGNQRPPLGNQGGPQQTNNNQPPQHGNQGGDQIQHDDVDF